MRKNLTICTWEGIAALPLVFLSLPANFIIAALLTKNFGITEAWYGVIASLPAWSNVAQLGLIPLLTRFFNTKAITLAAAWLHAACWTALVIALPRLPVESPHAAGLFFLGFFILSSLLAAVVGVSWTSWIQEWIPGKVRGKYFGNRNRLITIGTVCFLFTSGKLLGWFDSALAGYQILLGAAVAMRIVSIIGQHRILGKTGAGQTFERYRWRDYPAILKDAPGLVTFIMFGALFGFATSLIGPFYAIFMYEQLGLSVSRVSLLIILASTGGALSFPAWGRLLDSHGNKPVMIFCLALWQLQNFIWCVLTPANSWLLYPMWAFGGTVSAGYLLGSFNLLLKIMPPKSKTTGISIFLAVTSLVAAVAPILGGQLFAWGHRSGFDPMRVYHLSFLIQPILGLLSCLVLARIHEPRSASVRTVVGAMRSMRQIGALFGLTFMVNYVFLRRPKNRRQPPPETTP